MIAALLAVWSVVIPSWGSVTLLEAVWFAIGLLTMIVTGFAIPTVIRDAVTGFRADDKVLEVIAVGYVRREVLRFLSGSFVVALGAYSMSQPALIPGPARVTFVGLLLTVCLLGISLLTSAQAVLDRLQHRKITHLLAERNREASDS